MAQQRTNYLQTACYIGIFILLYLLTYTELFPLKIGNASPMPLIPAVVTVAFFYGEWRGFLCGLVTGLFADACASQMLSFNTFLLLFIGLAAGLLITHYLNKNIYSIAVLSLCSCIIYYVVKWIALYLISGSAQSSDYLLFYALPSAVYSALFIFPLYLLGRAIIKIDYK